MALWSDSFWVAVGVAVGMSVLVCVLCGLICCLVGRRYDNVPRPKVLTDLEPEFSALVSPPDNLMLAKSGFLQRVPLGGAVSRQQRGGNSHETKWGLVMLLLEPETEGGSSKTPPQAQESPHTPAQCAPDADARMHSTPHERYQAVARARPRLWEPKIGGHAAEGVLQVDELFLQGALVSPAGDRDMRIAWLQGDVAMQISLRSPSGDERTAWLNAMRTVGVVVSAVHAGTPSPPKLLHVPHTTAPAPPAAPTLSQHDSPEPENILHRAFTPPPAHGSGGGGEDMAGEAGWRRVGHEAGRRGVDGPSDHGNGYQHFGAHGFGAHTGTNSIGWTSTQRDGRGFPARAPLDSRTSLEQRRASAVPSQTTTPRVIPRNSSALSTLSSLADHICAAGVGTHHLWGRRWSASVSGRSSLEGHLPGGTEGGSGTAQKQKMHAPGREEAVDDVSWVSMSGTAEVEKETGGGDGWGLMREGENGDAFRQGRSSSLVGIGAPAGGGVFGVGTGERHREELSVGGSGFEGAGVWGSEMGREWLRRGRMASESSTPSMTPILGAARWAEADVKALGSKPLQASTDDTAASCRPLHEESSYTSKDLLAHSDTHRLHGREGKEGGGAGEPARAPTWSPSGSRRPLKPVTVLSQTPSWNGAVLVRAGCAAGCTDALQTSAIHVCMCVRVCLFICPCVLTCTSMSMSLCLSVCINMHVLVHQTLQVTISTREATPRAERERDPVLIGFPKGAAATQRAGPHTVQSDESGVLPRSASPPRGYAMHVVNRAPDSPLLRPLPPPEATADAGGREVHDGEDRRLLQQRQDVHRDGHGGGDVGSSSDGRSQPELIDASGVATRSSAGRSVA